MPKKMKKKAARTTAKRRKRPGRTAPPKPVEELDERRQEVEQDYASLRDRTTVLEARYSDLEEAHDQLTEEHVALKDRARVIDDRYTELVERTDEGSAPGTIQISAIELKTMRDELRRLRGQHEGGVAAGRMACPKCGTPLAELEHEGVSVDRCPGCGGVYLDKGELERVTAKREPQGFFERLNALFA